MRLLTVLLVLTPLVALGSPAEETTTLSTPMAMTPVVSVRVRAHGREAGGPLNITVQGCTSCATATPRWLDGTATHFQVGVKNAAGQTVTKVSGYAVETGGRPDECSVTPATLKQFVVNAVNANADDPIARAIKQVTVACLGGN